MAALRLNAMLALDLAMVVVKIRQPNWGDEKSKDQQSSIVISFTKSMKRAFMKNTLFPIMKFTMLSYTKRE